ncbi:hypothetical protein PRZ48_008955 [Zasmidium cellare]|uniref:Uncharacterized protein n=1 Tax=Zasmidium cellare TaxID=395010 RepID=A0ABR0EGZ3_ZASCE|nr:hypothetical protein PRZ48_008955 [Zasmidium cellare]
MPPKRSKKTKATAPSKKRKAASTPVTEPEPEPAAKATTGSKKQKTATRRPITRSYAKSKPASTEPATTEPAEAEPAATLPSKKRKTTTRASIAEAADAEPAASVSAATSPNEGDEASDEILNKEPPISRLSSELLNPILEMLVVHRDDETGEKRAIPMDSFRDIKERRLRASRTCRSIYTLMRDMFYGLNTFDIEQIEKLSLEPEGNFDMDERIAAENGVTLYRNSITLEAPEGLSSFVQQHTFLFPPPNVRCLLKELNVRLTIPDHIVRGELYPAQRIDLLIHIPSWLLVIDRLAKMKSLDLETLIITIDAPLDSAKPLPSDTEAERNRKWAKRELRSFVLDKLLKINATKIVVKFPEVWTDLGEWTLIGKNRRDRRSDNEKQGLEDPKT